VAVKERPKRSQLEIRYIEIFGHGHKSTQKHQEESLAQPTPSDIIQNEATSGAYEESLKIDK